MGEFRVVWDDEKAPATAINPPGQVSDPDFDTTNIGWLFAAGSTETLFIVLQLSHMYVEGSEVRPHVHWEATDGTAGNVLWRMSYQWRNNGESASGFTDVDLTAAASGTDSELQVDSFGAIAKSDALISSFFELKLSRIGGDAADTYASDARLKEFDLHYMKNAHGSNLEYLK